MECVVSFWDRGGCLRMVSISFISSRSALSSYKKCFLGSDRRLMRLTHKSLHQARTEEASLCVTARWHYSLL